MLDISNRAAGRTTERGAFGSGLSKTHGRNDDAFAKGDGVRADYRGHTGSLSTIFTRSDEP